MKSSIRWFFLIVLILVIIGMCVVTFRNKDSWFVTKTKITYPDGCVEQYKGTELLTSECTEGRKIVEENRVGVVREGNYSMESIQGKWNLTNKP